MSGEWVRVELSEPPASIPESVLERDPEFLAWLAGLPEEDLDWVPPELPEPPPEHGGPATSGSGTVPPEVGGPVSLRLLSVLAQKDLAGTPTGELVDELRAWQRFTGFSMSRIWFHLAELHARYTGPARTALDQAHAAGDDLGAQEAGDRLDLAERSLVAEVHTALTWTSFRAQDQLNIALVLTTDLVRTLDAVTHGRLEVLKAETIARALSRESSDLRRLVEAEILDGASGCTVPELRDRIRKAVYRRAPHLAAERARKARRERGVFFKAEADDMLRMEAVMPAGTGIRVRAALENAAMDLKADLQNDQQGGRRSLDQLRCDILSDALIGLTAPTTGDHANVAAKSAKSADHPDHPDHEADGDAGEAGVSEGRGARGKAHRRAKRGLRREVVLTVPLETITGDAEDPGYLARYGPLSAESARRMAAEVATDGYWRCAVTDDEHGTLLGLGRSTFSPNYQAPEFLKRFINTRDQVCDFPGCRQPAVVCDFEHTIPYPAGTTCEHGGRNTCRNHHRLKHETNWTVRRSKDPDHVPGTHVWTSPAGRDYLSVPPAVGVPRTDPSGPPGGGGATGDPGPTNELGRPVPDAWAYNPALAELPTAVDRGDRPEASAANTPEDETVPF